MSRPALRDAVGALLPSVSPAPPLVCSSIVQQLQFFGSSYGGPDPLRDPCAAWRSDYGMGAQAECDYDAAAATTASDASTDAVSHYCCCEVGLISSCMANCDHTAPGGSAGAIAMGPRPGHDAMISGEGGYICFRIPSLLRLPTGRLLLFAEGRKEDCGDIGWYISFVRGSNLKAWESVDSSRVLYL